jgi:hypothetical protein
MDPVVGLGGLGRLEIRLCLKEGHILRICQLGQLFRWAEISAPMLGQ